MTTTDDYVTSTRVILQEGVPDAGVGAALGGTLYFVTIVTILGNSFLLVIILKTSALRTVTNYFIVSLAISDLLTGVFVMPFCAAAILTGNWPFVSGYCVTTGFIHSVCSIATVLNLMMVCFDRAIAVAKPLKYSLWLTPWVAALMIAYVWLHSIIFSAIPFFNSNIHYTYGRAKGFCAFDWMSGSGFVLSYVTLCLLLPAFITFVFLLVIVKHARSRPTIMSLMPVPVAAVTVVVHSQPMVNYRRSTIQAMRTLFIITIAVTVLWTPQITVNIFDIRQTPKVAANIRTSAMWLCLMSSMTNPLIFLSNRKFKQKLKEIFCRCVLKRSNVVGIDTSVTQHTASTTLPYTSHYEPSNVFPRPSNVTIPEEEQIRRISFCEPQIRIGIKTELLLAVPNRSSKSVPVAKVEPLLRKSSEDPSRRISSASHASVVSRMSTVTPVPVQAVEGVRLRQDTVPHHHPFVDVESSLTTESSTTDDGYYPPVVLSVMPQLHAIPADMAEDATNDLI